MKKIDSFLLAALALGSATTFAAKDSTFHVQNSVRIGMDDNIYADARDEDSAFLTDIVNISGKMVFSSRTDLILYWQPEFRYRFDADPEAITYQDLYTQLSHAVSERVFVQVSDRFRYQEKDGQQTGVGLGTTDRNYFENDLMGSLDFTLDSLTQIKVGGGYMFRTWSEDSYGEFDSVAKTGGNDFDQLTVNGSFVREVRPNTTHALAGVNYVDHSYDGDRGGFDSTTIYGGVDHNFTSSLMGNVQVGYSFSSIDTKTTSNDADSPFLSAGLDYSATDRTSINGSIGYKLSSSENSLYNAQDEFKLGLSAKHDLTGKISVSSALTYIMSTYDSDYRMNGANIDADETYIRFGVRGSYQVTRNNFIDVGYQFSTRDSDAVVDYDRNRFDIGWKVRL